VAALPQPMAGALGGVGSVAAIGPGLRASITAPFASGDLRSMSLMNAHASFGAGAKSEYSTGARGSRPYSPGAAWSTGMKSTAPLTGSLAIGRERGNHGQTREAMDSFLLDFMKGASVL
jgi:hypothetical protein